MQALDITPTLRLPLSELRLSFDRSPGPGGQNVNKVNTRVELRFDVLASPSLSPEQRERLVEGLRTRLSREGILIVRSARSRSQARNREDCLGKFAALLAAALRPPPPARRPTRPARAARTRRMDEKRRLGDRKSQRQRPPID